MSARKKYRIDLVNGNARNPSKHFPRGAPSPGGPRTRILTNLQGTFVALVAAVVGCNTGASFLEEHRNRLHFHTAAEQDPEEYLLRIERLREEYAHIHLRPYSQLNSNDITHEFHLPPINERE